MMSASRPDPDTEDISTGLSITTPAHSDAEGTLVENAVARDRARGSGPRPIRTKPTEEPIACPGSGSSDFPKLSESRARDDRSVGLTQNLASEVPPRAVVDVVDIQ